MGMGVTRRKVYCQKKHFALYIMKVEEMIRIYGFELHVY